MKMKEIRNGSLYYNEGSERVERVVGNISKHRVVTYVHKQDYDYPQAKAMRLASLNEVNSYLGA